MTVGGILATILGLVVGIGGMWLAWRLVKRLPVDERHAAGNATADEASVDETSADEAPGE